MLISLDFLTQLLRMICRFQLGKNSVLIFYLEACACISNRISLSTTGTFLLCKYTSRQKCLIENPYGNKCSEDQTLHFLLISQIFLAVLICVLDITSTFY